MHKWFFSFFRFCLPLLLAGCDTFFKGIDLDGDGYSLYTGDCWDTTDPENDPPNGLTSAEVHPGAYDEPYDGFDADCAGDDDFDLDGDGYVAEEEHFGQETIAMGEYIPPHVGWGDCDDTNPNIRPGAPEVCDDGFDNDCDGDTDAADEDCDDGTDDTGEDTGHSDTGE